MSKKPSVEFVAIRWSVPVGSLDKIPATPGTDISIGITPKEGGAVEVVHCKSEDVAPWLSREEQEMILDALKQATLYRVDDAIALLQSRLGRRS